MSATTKHEWAGLTLKFKKPFIDHFGNEHKDFHVEDLWYNFYNTNWFLNASQGNMACVNYMTRVMKDDLPRDEVRDVLYGKTGPFGNLVHASELEPPTTT